MTEGYSLKLLRQKLNVLTIERNKIRELKPEELEIIEAHYALIITDLQKSIEKLIKDYSIPGTFTASSATNQI